jgi:hypothetical protein
VGVYVKWNPSNHPKIQTDGRARLSTKPAAALASVMKSRRFTAHCLRASHISCGRSPLRCGISIRLMTGSGHLRLIDTPAAAAECPLHPESGQVGKHRAKSAERQEPTFAPQQGNRYSITSSARASSVGGTSRPSAFAALRLRTNSNFVGCKTGGDLTGG